MSPKKEDYIKALFDLGGQVTKVSNKEIAERLGTSPPTVTEMMVSLEKIGWTEYFPYKGSLLTPEGAERAKHLIHKHRLWEVFLVDNLGFEIDEVHDEAEVLEHATSNILADRLERYLGHPEYCPHGGAIPLNLIDNQEHHIYRLSEAEEEETLFISRIVNESDLVSYFKNKKLNVGDKLTVISRDLANDSLQVKNLTQGIDIELSSSASQYLFVEHYNS